MEDALHTLGLKEICHLNLLAFRHTMNANRKFMK